MECAVRNTKEMTINSDPQLNDADLELLSAYIDRQLDDRERAALERRLSQDPVLHGVLDELRATVGMLRDLEPLRPPRSFAIAAPTPAPRRFWSFQWPAIASALVALVCVLTFSYALIGSSDGGSASAPAAAPAAMQEAAAPTAAPAAAAGAAPDSAMRQATTAAPAAAAPAAAAPTAAPAAEAPAAPMIAADAPTTAPAAAASMASPAPAATPAPTVMAASGTSAIATAQPAAEAQPAADSAAPTAAAAEAPISSALQVTAAPAQEPYNALVATSEISSPDTVTLDQPPIAPNANSAPADRSSNTGLIAGVVVLVLLIAIGIWLALRRRART
jgi:hypothetical protein